ncbi:hypothetical protein JCM9140_1965 [Halalkalibacter wakoensis JCM 9140]|uniref:Tripartite ATP-independent periplasmic transporters DctQ component domain-containing protein n=1 Tax=Halalkalibacter wakoensis JCM 9140 TaxID=1236970 RepID=W4Q1V1_9BACI|nr:TRAP transporter small permease [Halalkalibacter wakoensis]GAE25942.1 hypothetical protein JCM9140_1965 [Halalkalibacter wakoensis JCM 9140]
MVLSKFRRWFDVTVSSLSFTGTVWIAILMIIIVSDVIGRGLFNSPIQGVPEIVKNSIVGLTFLQLAHVLREGRHIRTTVLYDRVNDRFKKVLDFSANIAGMIIFSLIFYATIRPAIQAYELGTFEGNIVRIPTFPTYLLILIGSLFMFLQFLILTIDLFTKKSSTEPIEKEEN